MHQDIIVLWLRKEGMSKRAQEFKCDSISSAYILKSSCCTYVCIRLLRVCSSYIIVGVVHFVRSLQTSLQTALTTYITPSFADSLPAKPSTSNNDIRLAD